MEIVDIQLDATTELETASQFRIRGYPTVLLIYKVEFYIICIQSSVFMYGGSRQASDMAEKARKALELCSWFLEQEKRITREWWNSRWIQQLFEV